MEMVQVPHLPGHGGQAAPLGAVVLHARLPLLDPF